jgi:6-phosphogluconolactonase
MNARIVLICVFAVLASCGGGSSGGPPGVSSGFLYVNVSGGPNTFPTDIEGFAVSTSGALSPVPGSEVFVGFFGGGPIAITRDSRLLYTVSSTGQVSALQINADGSLANASVPSYDMSESQTGLLAHPMADFLYASGESGVLTVFAIDSGTGALSPTSSVTLGKFLIGSVITPNGRYLYQSDVDNGSNLFPESLQIAGFSTDAATGALSPVPGSPLTLTTSSPSTSTFSGPIAIEPTGKFLYVGYELAVVNVGAGGGLAAYSIDAASGALTAVPGSPFDIGGTPSSFAIDASGKFLIVSIFPLGGGSRLAVFAIDPATGALTSVPGSFGPTYVWGGVAADPSKPFVYAGTSSTSTNTPAALFVLSIDQTTGALTPIGETAFPNIYAVGLIALTH